MAVLKLRDRVWKLGGRTYIMGIANLTPDSFSDGGTLVTTEKAVEAAENMMADGADIIDIGGQSTRPGSTVITADDELSRIKETVVELGRRGIPFSVDTFYPEVALMVNDVSSRVTPAMAEIVREYGAAWVLMHNRDITGESDCVAAVKKDLEALVEEALAQGIAKENICLDPGIGFGKTNEQSICLLKNIDRLRNADYAFLTAASRKRCIGQLSGVEKETERDAATALAHAKAIEGGTDIIRIHNVKMGTACARVADSLFRR